MANKKFSEFTSQTDSANVQFVVGYNGSDNVRISPGNLLGAYLPLAGGTMTGSTIHNDNVKSIYGTSSDGLEIYHDASNSYISDTGTGDLRIWGANVEISTAGGNKYFSGAANVAKLYHTNNEKLATTSTGVSVTGDLLIDSGEYLSWGTSGTTAIEGSTVSNKLAFFTQSSEIMRIDSAGNVGIGTTSPGAKLEVANAAEGTYLIVGGDNASNARALAFTSSTSGVTNGAVHTINAKSGNGVIAFATGSTERMRINSSGNVGIGTTSPGAKLHVEGNLLVNAYNQGEDNGIFLREGFLTIDQPSITVWDMTNSGASPDGLSINANDGIRFRENSGEVARFKNGNFGIGTTSPDTKLHIAASSSNNQLTLERTGSATGKYLIYTNTNNLYFNNVASSTFPLTILNSGNVGIGTATPTAKLQVVGLAEHADNSAATTAGLTAGAFYRTGDLLKVVH